MMQGIRWVSVFLLAAGLVYAADPLREEFHQSYPLAAAGRVSLANVNGSVRVSTWDKNEVKVDAVKTARSQEALKETEIVVEARADAVEIRTKYPERSHRDREAANVDYTLTVPRGARLDSIKTVNGAVEIDGVMGDVRVASVNGTVRALRLAGEVAVSTVNGRVEAEFERLEGKRMSLKSVNGTVILRVPLGIGMQLSAGTVNGDIESDFDLPVRKIGFGPGRSLKTVIGQGGLEVSLHTVNGGIRLLKW
jgi:DUF4097 and DUF4098 domain-containing protein YvlB